jgi:hypothetical protein
MVGSACRYCALSMAPAPPNHRVQRRWTLRLRNQGTLTTVSIDLRPVPQVFRALTRTK